MFIFYHWKWPAQGTGTVPIVSAHFCSLYRRTHAAQVCWRGSELGGRIHKRQRLNSFIDSVTIDSTINIAITTAMTIVTGISFISLRSLTVPACTETVLDRYLQSSDRKSQYALPQSEAYIFNRAAPSESGLFGISRRCSFSRGLRFADFDFGL